MISDETSFSQFQYLVRVKFDGDVEELLQLLKSGGGEAVSVAQLAEYLMVSSQYWCSVSVGAVVVWCGVVWCGVVWCGVVWCGSGSGSGSGNGVSGAVVE